MSGTFDGTERAFEDGDLLKSQGMILKKMFNGSMTIDIQSHINSLSDSMRTYQVVNPIE